MAKRTGTLLELMGLACHHVLPPWQEKLDTISFTHWTHWDKLSITVYWVP